MTNTTLVLASLIALQTASAQSPQFGTPQPQSGVAVGTGGASGLRVSVNAQEPALTKFSLDFPGGIPKQLVGAIEKAMGRPLNAIIPEEYADTKLPPLKMSNVDVRQLFQALELASVKREAYVTSTYGPNSNYQQMTTSYGFRTQGPISDESVWYFSVEKPTLPPAQVRTPPKTCRYFSLTPYLDRGQTVDDITTAIQTGWKMLGDDDTPKISFHKETKLLIAVGDPGKLETIDAVLNALRSAPTSFVDPATGLPVSPTPARPIPQRTPKLQQPGAGAVQGNTSEPSKP